MAVISALQKSPDVAMAEPDFVTHTHVLPNDPYFNGTSPATYPYQWALRNTGQVPPGGTSGADIHATDAWDITTGSSSVIVGVLDSGIPMLNGSLSHPDLDDPNKIVLGANYAGGSEGVRDLFGHGTHAAGIAAAETNNGTGIAGVAWNCKIMVIRVFDANGGGYDSYFYNGVHYAVDYVRNNPTYKIVINYSGEGGVSSVLESAVSYANTYGVTIVASAGNDYGGAVKYPAAYSSSYPNVVAVSATDQNDVVSSYSNAGPQINVSAPGGYGGSFNADDIYSTTPNYSFNLGTLYGVSQNYGYLAGTSMAAPHVSGTVALMLSINPNLTPSQIRSILQSTATKVSGMGGQNFTYQYGYGRLNAGMAVYDARLLQNPISGPRELAINQRGTWTVSPTGGTGSYTYAWYLRSNATGGQWTGPVSTSSSYSTIMHSSDGYLYVRSDVTSGVQQSSTSRYVTCSDCSGGPLNPQIVQDSVAADGVPANVEGDVVVGQNYPNPFNPTTEIRFTLLKPNHVTLVVYDMLGREVARLADEQMSAGYHAVTWNASGKASGVYIYRLTAGNTVRVERMILMK